MEGFQLCQNATRLLDFVEKVQKGNTKLEN